MGDGFASNIRLVIKIIGFIGVAVPLLIFFLVFRKVLSFKDTVFKQIGSDVFQKINLAPKPNRSYVKTKCDHCGAKCTGATEITPSGDIKCSYCDNWFNVLRT